MNARIVAYTDGSVSNNGYDDAAGGFAVWYGDDDDRNISEVYDDETTPPTNQNCELMAVKRALQTELAPHQHLFIVTDSRYALSCATVWSKKWKVNGWKNSKDEAIANKNLIQEIVKLVDSLGDKVGFAHCKAHTGIVGNEEADKLAKAGRDKAKKSLSK